MKKRNSSVLDYDNNIRNTFVAYKLVIKRRI